MRTAVAQVLFWCVVCLWGVWLICPAAGQEPRVASGGQTEVHRSPVDLALLPGGRFALTANSTADSVSLVDLEQGKVLAEQRCGHKPSAVACARDGKRAAVSNLWSG